MSLSLSLAPSLSLSRQGVGLWRYNFDVFVSLPVSGWLARHSEVHCMSHLLLCLSFLLSPPCLISLPRSSSRLVPYTQDLGGVPMVLHARVISDGPTRVLRIAHDKRQVTVCVRVCVFVCDH